MIAENELSRRVQHVQNCLRMSVILLQVGGKYVAYGKVKSSSKLSCSPDLAAGLWQASIKLTGEDSLDHI